MSNHHCGQHGCVLSPHHTNVGTPHRNAAGYLVGGSGGRRESVRQRCFLLANLASSEVRAVVSRAANIDPYITLSVIQSLDRPLNTVGPAYVINSLGNHGLTIKETQ